MNLTSDKEWVTVLKSAFSDEELRELASRVLKQGDHHLPSKRAPLHDVARGLVGRVMHTDESANLSTNWLRPDQTVKISPYCALLRVVVVGRSYPFQILKTL